MHLGLLTMQPENYSSTRLAQAIGAQGHEAVIVPFLDCVVSLHGPSPTLTLHGEPLTMDAAIPRVGQTKTQDGLAVVRQLELMGVPCLNSSQGIAQSRDKLHALQVFARHRLPAPRSGWADTPKAALELIKAVGGPPVVMKLLQGTQGKGVVLAKTRKDAEAQLAAFAGLKGRVLVQEFIRESAGRDVRVLVLGGRVAAAMERVGERGDFRSNLHQGGKGRPVTLSPAERRVAVKAAQVLGLNFAGVDLLRSRRGPLLLEVNSSPGLEGIEETTGQDMAGAVVKFVAKTLVSAKQRHR